jgi:hypothetical protein
MAIAPSRGLAMLVSLLLVVGCGHGPTANGPTAAWNGTWKLNTAKTRVQGGADFTIATLPDGEMRMANNAFNFDFRCDGKYFPNPNGQDLTTSCLQASAAQWKLTYKQNGTVTSEALWDLSPDAKVLTIRSKSALPDGSTKPFEHIFHRMGEGSGLTGRWGKVNPLESLSPILSLSLAGDRLHYAYSDTDYVDAPLDGTRAPVYTGPQARPGFSMSIKQEGPLQMHTESLFEGHVIREGTLMLSKDGHTMVHEYWVPGRKSEKDSLVYEK